MKATEVIAGLAESNGSLPPGGWLKVTCGLTACTLESAPDPTLGNKHGRTFLFLHSIRLRRRERSLAVIFVNKIIIVQGTFFGNFDHFPSTSELRTLFKAQCEYRFYIRSTAAGPANI